MKFKKTGLNGSFIIEHETMEDNRGSFSRLICLDELKQIGHADHFVQVNRSYTLKAGSVRGLHFQVPPAAEIKIVKCTQGAIFDVIIDIRKKSPTFLEWYGHELTNSNMQMMYVPKGFAHGFQTLHPDSELLYFHTAVYSPDHEGALHYNDPRLAIEWPLPVTEISPRDASHQLINRSFKGLIL